MFERFTDRARRVIVIAQDEARTLQHDFIRPEHLLLGLAKGDGVAAVALRRVGMEYESLRERVSAGEGSVAFKPMDKVPFSPAAKKVLERSLREALALGHNYIGTEHILLGILHGAEKGDHDAAAVLDVDIVELRATVLRMLSGVNTPPGGSTSPAAHAVLDRARQATGQDTMTTSHLASAILADPHSHASKALASLGVTDDVLAGALGQVDVSDTSDAMPPAQPIEIKVGDTTVTIDDPELATALRELNLKQIQAGLRRGFMLGAEIKSLKVRKVADS